MLTRRELEEILGCKLTDEQWKENRRILAEAAEREWDEAHPMDE